MIRDIPQIQHTVKQARQLSSLKDALPVLKPFLIVFGIDIDSIEGTLDETDIKELEQKALELGSIPDKFNDTFAEKGWIIHEDMNLNVAKNAVEKAELESVESAEELLISHYDPETVRFNLNRMKTVDAFRPRIDLAYKALSDYEEGRYHACVPVVLAIMDGLVQDTYKEAHGYGRNWSTKKAQLEAWNSLAGHSKGLERLQELHLESRFKTVTEEIEIPYRNGIIHGMDLGYDNEAVAAKTWAALFALREWAMKAEQDELTAPDKSQPTLWETLQETYESWKIAEETKRQIEEWEPRSVVVGDDVPADGKPEDYKEDTPERALVEFLSYWQENNFGYMAQSLIQPKTGNCENPGDLREEFEGWNLKSHRILDIDDVGAARTDITVALTLEIFGRQEQGEARATLIRLDEQGNSAIRDVDDGTWTITNRVVLRTPT